MKKSYIIIIGLVLLGGVFWQWNSSSTKLSNTPVKNASVASESQVIDLKDGETYDIVASIVKKVVAGQEIKMLAYNGSVPGPVLRVTKDSEITINFTNNTDIPTTIHSHGVRLDNKYDGVPDVTQKVVGIGGSFSYKIKFPDEGVYWYHPHFREDYAQELGLYGNYIVTSKDPNYWLPVNKEIPLMVDDILMDQSPSGQLTIVPFGAVANYTLMGRYGNIFLVNGVVDNKVSIRQGEVVRFYITNTANTRVFRLSIPGVKLKLVGGDNGKYERETFVDEIIISPSERYVIDAFFERAGMYKLVHNSKEEINNITTFEVSSENVDKSYKTEFQTLRTNKDTIASIDPLRQYFDKPVDKSLTLTIDMSGMGMSGGMHMMPDGTMMSNSGMMMGGNDKEKIEWEDNMQMMNSMSTSKSVKWKIVDNDTKKANEKIDWKFKKGDKVKIKIFNDPKSIHPMQHPFHIHGQKFLVLSTNGVKNTNLVWKDTTLIQKGDTVEILVDMENPGMWMAHCHIAEHLESGMMFMFEVK
ncbi:MAG: multicopper oxidase family protein [Minisyncoccia bacterium]